MGDEIDSEIIKATQNSLGKYVKRPPLSEKLLRKPPFRFLHDIITTVLKTTGFFNGLFEEKELISENVKDRDSKIQFLNKIIFVLDNTTGKLLATKPSKVIAGQEPDKTNELLQTIAFALDNKLTSDEAVKKYKESLIKTVGSDTKSKDNKKPIKKTSEVKTNKNSIKNETNIVKLKQKDLQKKDSGQKKTTLQSSQSTIKKIVEHTKIDKNVSKNTSNKSENEVKVNKEVSKINFDNSEVAQDIDAPTITQKEDIEIDKNDEIGAGVITDPSNHNDGSIHSDDNIRLAGTTNLETDISEKKNNDETDAEININGDSKNNDTDIVQHIDKNIPLNNTNHIHSTTTQHQLIKGNSFESFPNESIVANQPIISRPQSVRPSSSRPGAPRLREKNEENINHSDNILVGKVNIIVENSVQEEDEESSIVIIENDVLSSDQSDNLPQINSNEHGHLVQQILKSQLEFSNDAGKTEVEWQLGAKKARDIVNQEIDNLRFNLQALTRVANPLGKLLDHIQEDVEVMRQELQYWTKTYESARKELIKQKKINKEKLQPLYSKIQILTAEITEKHEKINDLKMTIHKNALRIDKLLANGNRQ